MKNSADQGGRFPQAEGGYPTKAEFNYYSFKLFPLL